ncbi:selenide, water dikinase [Thermotomaculum hydrothermale]|uniref:Selenide, water dikinase n=1 Tax=Thermotomaculum hydrothermale TaxID=981385 RepID=A0A7R6PZ97_9BACT|nr:selenide, water dikinase [Thermotomaculum hydrothermale]
MQTNDDAGVVRVHGNKCLVQTADFITPVVDDLYMYGKIAAANSLSDVFAMGGDVLTALNLVMYDSCHIEKEEMREILKGGFDAVNEAGGIIIGGHTVEDSEMKYGLSVTGIVEEEKIVRNNNAKVGDKIILTKPLGMGIITTANKVDMVSEKTMKQATEIMGHLNLYAKNAMIEVGVNSATDITGFGLIGHAFEMAKHSGVSFLFNTKEIDYLDEALYLSSIGMVPAGSYNNKHYTEKYVLFERELKDEEKMIFFDAQTSGGLLISVPEEKASLLVDKIKEKGGIYAKVIGEVIEKQDKILIFS